MQAIAFALSALLALHPVLGGFDWGDGCDGGSGTFTQSLPTAGQTVTIGTIAAGKWNLLIKLESDKDVDVQLFDESDESCGGGEKAIIAYSETKGCVKGTLGNNDGSKESTVYKGMSISYSGYYGVDGKMGFEYIRLEGEVLTPLVMKAFAFEAGSAKVDYEWGYTRTTCCLGILPCWDETKDPPAPFSFSASVEKGATVDIGTIPVGKKDLRVDLVAQEDVDVQLYDKSDAAQVGCPSGKPIIAYSDKEGECNKGPLGNNDGSAESTVYQDVTYKYSGYEGTNGNLGNEFLELEGVVNRPLLMKAFGYGSGSFEVTYEYYEQPPDGEVPTDPSIHWLSTKNNKNNLQKNMFTGIPEDYIIVRRGQSFEFLIFGGASATLTKEMVTIGITGQYATEEYSGDPREYRDNYDDRATAPYKTSIDQEAQAYPSDAYSVEFESDSNNRLLVKLSFTTSAPVGEYDIKVKVEIPGKEAGGRGRASEAISAEASGKFIVLFNPYDSSDAVYTSDSNRKEYIENDKGLVWQGLSDNNNGFGWSFDQWKFENLQVAYDRLFRMPVADRADPVLVSRHLTYSIGEDVCYGKWGEGSYTTGKPWGGYTCSKTDRCKPGTSSTQSVSPFDTTITKNGWGEPTCNTCTTPDDWRDSTNLFRVHRTVKKKVQYCQCFVYAAITTTIGRALGIPTRPVTTFQSAHDTDKNRAIEKFYTIDPSNGEFVPLDSAPTADSVWSFHVWNEMYFKRPEFTSSICRELGFSASASRKGCANGWQAVDATPQESSMGGSGLDPTKAHYQMGPASINLVKANVDPICPLGNNTKYGCFDNEFVISEVNSNVNMWLKIDPAKPEEVAAEYHAGLGYRLYGEQGFFSDPWGDVYNTIGLQISTKKKGDISENCKKEEEKDCSKELDDITKYYKKKEDSGPGIPTMPGHAMKGTDSSQTAYYVPDINAEGHRRLTPAALSGARRSLDTTSGVIGPGKDSTLAMGTWPGKATDPIANEPSNPYSSVYVDFPFKNEGSDDEVVRCSYKAYVSDYTGSNLIKIATTNTSITLAAGAEDSCKFKTLRTEWFLHASTYMDNAMNDKVPIVDKNNIPYFLKFEVTATVDSTKEIFVGQRIKKLAEVAKTTTTSYFYKNIKDKVPKGDLLDLIATDLETCKSDQGLSSTGFNNGVCDISKNTPEKCFDGGDCCIASCAATHGGMAALGEAPYCNLPADDSLCHDNSPYKNYQPPSTEFDRQSPEDILGTRPVAFEDSGGAADLGFDICTSVYDVDGNLEGSVGLVDDMIANHFGAGNACEVPESDECKALLNTLLCDTDKYARALRDCKMDMIDATEIALTADNLPRCKTRTISGCLCKSSYENGDGVEFTGRVCETDTKEEPTFDPYCFVVEGSCDNGGRSPYDGSEWDHIDRWDYCSVPKIEKEETVEWTEEIQENILPEAKMTAENVMLKVKPMAVTRGFVPAPEPTPDPVSYNCVDGELYDERKGVCKAETETCASGEGLVDGACKTVCDAGRRFLDETTDGSGCITMADSPDDCGGRPEPEPEPKPEVKVEVQGAIDFANFDDANFPALTGSDEYNTFKANVEEGLATTLGVEKEKVTVITMMMVGGRRGRRTRRMTTSTLKVVFKVEMESSDAAAVVKAEVQQKIETGKSDGSLVDNIEDASTSAGGEAAVWSDVTVGSVEVDVGEESGGEEETEEETEEEKEFDTGEAADNSSILEDDSIKLILGGCATIAGLGIVGWIAAAFLGSGSSSSSGGLRSTDDFGIDKGRNSML